MGARIPQILHPQILARSQELAHSFRLIAEWLKADHGVEVTGEAVRKLVRRIERLPVAPAAAVEDAEETADAPLEDPAAQSDRFTKLCWRELKRAQRIVRQSPTEWRRLHSALSLTSRQIQAQLRPGRAGDDGAGQAAGSAVTDVFALPTFGAPQPKPEAS